jgi:hypothetical protein
MVTRRTKTAMLCMDLDVSLEFAIDNLSCPIRGPHSLKTYLFHASNTPFHFSYTPNSLLRTLTTRQASWTSKWDKTLPAAKHTSKYSPTTPVTAPSPPVAARAAESKAPKHPEGEDTESTLPESVRHHFPWPLLSASCYQFSAAYTTSL